jgi:hypothetical protein
MFKLAARLHVSNGRTTRFWTDSWLGRGHFVICIWLSSAFVQTRISSLRMPVWTAVGPLASNVLWERQMLLIGTISSMTWTQLSLMRRGTVSHGLWKHRDVSLRAPCIASCEVGGRRYTLGKCGGQKSKLKLKSCFGKRVGVGYRLVTKLGTGMDHLTVCARYMGCSRTWIKFCFIAPLPNSCGHVWGTF